MGAAMTVTGDGTVVADTGAATSRIPAAGVRLSESLATSHETRAAEARTLSRHWSAEAGMARNAAVTDATAMIERYSHDVSTGEAYARGVTESESSQAQALDSHVEKLSEIAGISKNQVATLTGQASVGGGWDFIVKAKADGSVMWRGQTIEQDAWNRMKEYDRQHGVTETWSQVSEASRRYSDLHRRQRDGGARREPQRQPHAHAQLPGAGVAGEAGIGELVRAGRPGALRRPGDRARAGPALLRLAVGAAGNRRPRPRRGGRHAHRLAADGGGFGTAPRVCRRVHRREVSGAGGTGPGLRRRSSGIRECGRGAARRLRTETAAAYGGWSAGVRDRAASAGAPRPGETDAAARAERVETKTEQIMKGTAREARQTVTRDEAAGGRAGVAVETGKSFEHHATENLPVVGDWLAGKLFGTAQNAVPDGVPGAAETARRQDEKGWGDSSP